MSLVLLLLLACSPAPTDGSAAPPAPVAVAADAPPAFVDDQGRLACPVMGDPIASPDRAAGHLDHDGRRYYFCCNSCEVLFREDPERYADGRHLREQGTFPGGASCADGEASCEG